MGHEAVHGKATILQKMYGEYENKFPQARAPYLYMYTHPGKKLNFMGNEIGQLREWDEKMVVLLNFSDQAQNYLLDAGKYRAMELVISTDNERYGCSSLYR